jgi:hypothetical protein
MFLMVSGAKGRDQEDRWMMTASTLKGVRLSGAGGDFVDRLE